MGIGNLKFLNETFLTFDYTRLRTVHSNRSQVLGCNETYREKYSLNRLKCRTDTAKESRDFNAISDSKNVKFKSAQNEKEFCF